MNNEPTLISGTVPEGTGRIKNALDANIPPTPPPKTPEPEMPEEKPLLRDFPTRKEVERALRGIVKGIQERFLTRDDAKEIMGGLEREVKGKDYVTRSEAHLIAWNTVPRTLRNLDSKSGSTSPRPGNVLLLAPAGNSGTDEAYWGEIKAGSGGRFDWSKVEFGFTVADNVVTLLSGEIDGHTVPGQSLTVTDGAFIYVQRTIATNSMAVYTGASVPADNASYVYYKLYQFNVVTTVVDEVTTYTTSLRYAFRPFRIEGIKVPFGSASLPHLIWNSTSGIWEAGLIPPGDTLPSGGSQYMVLQKGSGGAVIWDWTRWAVST